jgi:hypothetical protein
LSTTVNVDGTNFEVPANSERGWGTETSDLLIALAGASLLIKGGSIPLTSEADFGSNFGLKTIYYKSGTADPSATGVLRLANTDAVKWRNGANNADLSLSITSDKLQYEGVDVVGISTTDTLTNKTIDAALNTLSNVDTTMLASGVLNTSTTLTGAADTNIPSTLAVKTYIDAVAPGDLSYTPTTPGDWPDPDPTTVQEGLDNLASERTLETDFTAHTGASTAHGVAGDIVGTSDNQTLTTKTIVVASNTVTTAASGNLVATELNAALAELQTDIDTRALDADLTTHENDTANPHAVTQTQVGLSNVDNTSDATKNAASVVLTNKTIDADNNTISNLEHGNEVDNPSSGVHGVTGSVVGTTDAQVLTGKDIDGGTATDTSRITIPKAAKATLDALTRKEGTLVYASDENKLYADNGTALAEIGSGGSGAGGLEPTPIDHTNLPLVATTGKFYLVDMSGASGDETLTLPNISTETESIGVQIVAAHATHSLIIAADASDTIETNSQVRLINQSDWRVLNAQSSSNWFSYRASSGTGVIVGSTTAETFVNNLTTTDQYNNITWYQSGEVMKIDGHIRFSTSASSAGTMEFTLPDGKSIADTTNRFPLGSGYMRRGDNDELFLEIYAKAKSGDATKLEVFGSQNFFGSSALNRTVFRELTGSDTLNDLFINTSIPIAEYSSQGTTVTLSDLTARTKWVDNTVVPITLSGASSGLTSSDGQFQAYRDSEGNYSLKGHVSVAASPLDSDFNIVLDNAGGSITFYAADHQSVDAVSNISGTRTVTSGRANANSDSINIQAAGAMTEVWATFDLRLKSKPGWFDEHVENSQSIDAQVEEATSTVAGIVKANKATVRKMTSSSFNIGNTDIAQFRLSNLVDGNIYKLTMVSSIEIIPGSTAIGQFIANYDSSILLSIEQRIDSSTASMVRRSASNSIIFTATSDSTITFDFDGVETGGADVNLVKDPISGAVSTHVMIEELQNYELGTDFV